MSEEDLVQVRMLIEHLEEAGIADPVQWIEEQRKALQDESNGR